MYSAGVEIRASSCTGVAVVGEAGVQVKSARGSGIGGAPSRTWTRVELSDSRPVFDLAIARSS